MSSVAPGGNGDFGRWNPGNYTILRLLLSQMLPYQMLPIKEGRKELTMVAVALKSKAAKGTEHHA